MAEIVYSVKLTAGPLCPLGLKRFKCFIFRTSDSSTPSKEAKERRKKQGKVATIYGFGGVETAQVSKKTAPNSFSRQRKYPARFSGHWLVNLKSSRSCWQAPRPREVVFKRFLVDRTSCLFPTIRLLQRFYSKP